MNKREIVAAVAEQGGLSTGQAESAVDAALGAIASALAAGDAVSIPGFGTFEVRERAARSGRNPQTGAPLEIPATKAPAFKPATALKRSVNGG